VTPIYQHAFLYQGELYMRVIPGKMLFKSTMVHEVVNRGDVFAVRLRDCALTIISGKEAPARCMIRIQEQEGAQLELPI
jgi:hypothetical protein